MPQIVSHRVSHVGEPDSHPPSPSIQHTIPPDTIPPKLPLLQMVVHHMSIQRARHLLFTLGAIERPFGPIFTETAEILHVYLSFMHGGK